MIQIFGGMLAGVCSRETGQLYTAIERLENLSDEVTEGRSSVRVDEERVERGGWIVNREKARTTLNSRIKNIHGIISVWLGSCYVDIFIWIQVTVVKQRAISTIGE